MPANDQLIELIKKLSEKKNNGAIKALDALLSVNLSESTAHASLKNAIKSQEFFWKDQGFDSIELIQDSNLNLIQQAAATQRVLYDLENSDEKVLISILGSANADKLREYISKNTKIFTDAKPPIKVDKTLIPDDQSDLIKTFAAQLLLTKKIATTKDNKLLKALIKASDEASTIQAVKAFEVKFDLKEISEEHKTLAKDAYFKLVFPTLKSKQLSSEAQLSSITMDSIKGEIQTLFDVTLLPAQQEQAQSILGLRYLEEALESDAKVGTSYIAYDATQIQSLITDTTLKTLVTADTIGSLKASMAINLIKQTKLDKAQDLVQLANTDPDNLDAFKKALEKLEIKPTDWVNEENASKIHNSVKAKVLQLGVEQRDSLETVIKSTTEIKKLSEFARTGDFQHLKIATGAIILDEGQKRQLKTAAAHQAIALRVKELSIGPRSSLLNALKQLSTEKLLILVAPDNKDLEHLLHATNPNIVRHYCDWLVDEEKVAAETIVEENTQEAYCRQIRNGALAQAFANSDVKLDKDIVFEINKQIGTASTAKQLIDGVTTTTWKGKSVSIKDTSPIETQFNENKSLNNLIQRAYSSPVKKVLTVLANLNTPFSIGSRPLDVSILRALEAKKDAQSFIEQLLKSLEFKSPETKEAFEKELTNALSETTYESIRNSRKMEILGYNTNPANEEKQNEVVAEVTKELDNKKNTREELLRAAKGLTSIPGLKSMQGLFANGVQGVGTLPDFSKLSGAMLDAKIRANAGEWSKIYNDALESNSDSIDFLTRSRDQIQNYLNDLKNPTNPNIINLKKKLELELAEIKRDLKLFEEAQQKVLGTLQAIDRVTQGTAVSVYTHPYIKHNKVFTDADLDDLKEKAAKAPKLTVRNDDENSIDNHVVDKQVSLTKESTHASVVIENRYVGEFTQTFGVTRYDNKPNQSTFELVMTKDIDKTKVSGSDQAAFYMIEALSIIKANGGPPTKDKPLYVGGTNDTHVQGVWTALHLICEKKYGYRHSTFMQAVKIDIGGFDPDNVVDNTMLRGAVFRDNSMYKQIFESNKLVDKLLKDVDKIKAEVKSNQSSLSAVDGLAKGVASMQNTIKDKLLATKNEAQSRVVAGPAPEEIKPSLKIK